jgi:hypothetical protein
MTGKWHVGGSDGQRPTSRDLYLDDSLIAD